MLRHNPLPFVFFVLIVSPLTADEPAVHHLGLTDSLVRDLPAGKRKIVETDLASLVEEFAGFKAKVDLGGDWQSVGKKLADGQLQWGIFQGVEFAWAQAKNPKLQPALIAVISKQPKLHALLVVKKDSPLTGFADLKGKNVNILSGPKAHCTLFTGKGAQGDVKTFFAKLNRLESAETALDEVLQDKVAAAIVDNIAMENYKDINPGRFNRLKVLVQSEVFPTGVIAYQKGSISDKTLDAFRKGLLKANANEKGRETMATFKISSLETVPGDYQQQVTDIVKAYPGSGK